MTQVHLNNLTINLTTLTNGQLITLQKGLTDELQTRMFKEVVSAAPKVKSPDEIRKEIVTEAKNAIKLKASFFETNDGTAVKPEYIINVEKRTVAVILRGAFSGVIRRRGIAKCDPNDVFNEHIGKVIALYRGLGKPVPEQFLNVPQPTIKEAGQVVKYSVNTYKLVERGSVDWKLGETAHVNSVAGQDGKIINDSDVK
jgi:hypothetical protein